MPEKLNKKQINQIALMWSGSLLSGVGTDSFENGFHQENEVVDAVHKISRKMLKDLPLLHTLPDIIKYVQSNK